MPLFMFSCAIKDFKVQDCTYGVVILYMFLFAWVPTLRGSKSGETGLSPGHLINCLLIKLGPICHNLA